MTKSERQAVLEHAAHLILRKQEGYTVGQGGAAAPRLRLKHMADSI